MSTPPRPAPSTSAMPMASSESSRSSRARPATNRGAIEYVFRRPSPFLLQRHLEMIRGYSDRINHAFAFAAKHHDQQVRKGTRLPYLTHPANVAVILTRYGRDDDTVVSGILHDVIEDCVRSGYTSEARRRRAGEKFGETVLTTVVAVTGTREAPDGSEFSYEERKADYLERLAQADDRARWVGAADKNHNASSILADLKRTE